MDDAAIPWRRFAAEAPELEAPLRARFEAFRHHVLGTVRRDGAPRLSGTEVAWFDGDLVLGMMPGSVKALDLVRDPRWALHTNPGDGSMEGGDGKVAGVAVEEHDAAALAAFVGEHSVPPGPFHLFRLRVTSAALTTLHPEGDRLVITSYRTGRGVEVVERR